MLESVEPKQRNLKKTTLDLKELEMEKAYFESIGLHKVSSVQVENKSFWGEESSESEIVDTIEIENNKT